MNGQVKPVDAGQTIHHKTPKVFLLKGATIIPEPGKVIAEGEIVIRDGLIHSSRCTQFWYLPWTISTYPSW